MPLFGTKKNNTERDAAAHNDLNAGDTFGAPGLNQASGAGAGGYGQGGQAGHDYGAQDALGTGAYPAQTGLMSHSQQPQQAGATQTQQQPYDAAGNQGLTHTNHFGGEGQHLSGGGRIVSKVEHAVGSLVGSQALKAKGMQKEQEALAINAQSSEIAEAERLEKEAMLRRERAVQHGAHPSNKVLGGGQQGQGFPGAPGSSGKQGYGGQY